MDDFFEDLPKGNAVEENGVNTDMPPSKQKKWKKIGRAASAIALAAVCFALGGLSVWFSLDGEVRTLLKVKKAVKEHYYEDISDEEFYKAVFDGVNNQLLDGYSRYMTADEYRISKGELAGNRIGIGLSFLTKDSAGKEQMLVTRVCGNSPAAEAGVQEGDFVVAYGATQEEMTESLSFADFSAFLSGVPVNKDFYLRVKRGSAELVLTAYRTAYVENYVFYRTNTESYGFTGKKADVWTAIGEPLTCLPDDTAYIRLIQFGEDTEKQFEETMAYFQKSGKKNLVLDLRDNGGGYLDTMQDISGYFCKNTTEKRPVVVTAKYKNGQEIFKAERNVYREYFSTDSRICILANGGSASASECLIGAMVDYGATAFSDICLMEENGVAKTFGKGIMQTTFYLSAGLDAVKLTTAQIYWPVSDRSIHGVGVLPTDGTKTALGGVYGDAEILGALKALNIC